MFILSPATKSNWSIEKWKYEINNGPIRIGVMVVDMPLIDTTVQTLSKDSAYFKLVLPRNSFGLLNDRLSSYNWNLLWNVQKTNK